MLRRWELLVISAALAAVLPLANGCGKSQQDGSEGSTKRFYLIVKASESEFWQIVMAGAKHEAQELGVELVAQAATSESDVAKQIGILESAISARPDAIILAPTVTDSLVPGLERAAEVGIPVIIIDSSANTDQYVSFLASDNTKIGQIAADQLAEALERRTGKAEGKIAGLAFMSGVGSLEKRKKGFLETLAEKYPGIEVVAFQDAQGKQGTTLAIVQNYLIAYPDLLGIFATNQNTGDETVRALDLKNKKDLAVVVIDAGPQEVWGLENGYVDAIIVQKPWTMGVMGVQYALKAISGEPLEKFVDTGVVAISPEMIKSGEAEEFLKPLEHHGVR